MQGRLHSSQGLSTNSILIIVILLEQNNVPTLVIVAPFQFSWCCQKLISKKKQKTKLISGMDLSRPKEHLIDPAQAPLTELQSYHQLPFVSTKVHALLLWGCSRVTTYLIHRKTLCRPRSPDKKCTCAMRLLPRGLGSEGRYVFL